MLREDPPRRVRRSPNAQPPDCGAPCPLAQRLRAKLTARRGWICPDHRLPRSRPTTRRRLGQHLLSGTRGMDALTRVKSLMVVYDGDAGQTLVAVAIMGAHLLG